MSELIEPCRRSRRAPGRRCCVGGADRHGQFTTHFDQPSLDFSVTETAITSETIAELQLDRGPLPPGPVGSASDAAPGAERRGPGHPGGDRGLRRHPRTQRRRGERGGHLLHHVQASSGGGVPRRRLHHRTVRDHGRGRGVRPAARSSGNRQRRDHDRRKDHPRARGVQRRLRLRTGDDGQLGVLRQRHSASRPPRWWTSSGPAKRSVRPAAHSSAPGARRSGCWPVFQTARPTKARPRWGPPCWG